MQRPRVFMLAIYLLCQYTPEWKAMQLLSILTTNSCAILVERAVRRGERMAIGTKNHQVFLRMIIRVPINVVDFQRAPSRYGINLAPSTPCTFMVRLLYKKPAYGPR